MSLQLPMIAVLASEIGKAPRTWSELRDATGADPEQLDLLLSRMLRRGEAVLTHLGWALPKVQLKDSTVQIRILASDRYCRECRITKDTSHFEPGYRTCQECRKGKRSERARAKQPKRSAS